MVTKSLLYEYYVLGIGALAITYLAIRGTIGSQIYGFIPDAVFTIAFLVMLFFTRKIWNLTPASYSLIAFGFVLHNMGFLGFYGKSLLLDWDHITHLFGAMSFAVLFYKFFEPKLEKKIATIKNTIMYFVAGLAAFGAGAIIELLEFIAYIRLNRGDGILFTGPGDGLTGLAATDLIEATGSTYTNVGYDLVYNMAGILIAITLLILWRAVRSKFK
ncbi:MAG: hypothetical protein AABW84_01230 [Nanoarchaeota archaeon]